MSDPLSWILIVICIFGHFFFSISETSLALCNKFKMQVEADKGSKVSALVVKVSNKYDHALTTILVGNNIVAVAISTISTLLFYNYLTGIGLEAYASLLSSIIMTIIVYLVGDTLPKTIAKAIPDTISKIVVYPIFFLNIIFYPITIIFDGLVKLFEVIFKRESDEVFTSDDLETVLEKSEKEGIFEEEEVEIIQSAIEFADKKASEVLKKRRNIFALDINELTHEKLNEAINSTSYSRIPIYREDLDKEYLGTLHVKTYIKEYLKNPHIDIESILQPAYVVENKIMLVDLLDGFKDHHTHLAMVKKNDHIIGMVTMEDVLEELVEDISEPNTLRKEAK